MINSNTTCFNNLHQTKCNIKKEFDNLKYQNRNNNNNNNNIVNSNKMNGNSQKHNDHTSSIDLSGYLIFVTSNRNGSIKVYG
jgi:hypothetical protein